MSGEKLLKLQFDVEGGDVETLWAEPLGGRLYRLDNSPFYAYGVSWRDVVEADPEVDDGLPVFRRVVEKSGHRTVRVLVERPDELDRLRSGITELGCTFEGAWSRLISVDVPPEVELESVRRFLEATALAWEQSDPTED